MKRIGLALAIITVVAAVPVVASAWQGDGHRTDVSVSGFAGHMFGHRSMGLGAASEGTAEDRTSQMIGRAPTERPGLQQAPVGQPDASGYGPSGCPMWDDSFSYDSPSDWPYPAPNGPGYGPSGCPMWDDSYPYDSPSDWPYPAPNGPGYGPGGCPMWDDSYPKDPGTGWGPGYGHHQGGPMWGDGMMGRRW